MTVKGQWHRPQDTKRFETNWERIFKGKIVKKDLQDKEPHGTINKDTKKPKGNK